MSTWSRRMFLGGAAVAVGLPWLRSASRPARAADDAPPRRFVAWYVPNGMHMPSWTPTVGDPLPPILLPIEDVRDRIDVVSGLYNGPADLDSAGQHAAGTAGFLTARRAHRSEHELRLGESIDHTFVRHHAPATVLDVLPLGLDGGDPYGDCDNGFACAYSRNISWSDESTPRPKVVDPRLAFDLMFGGDDPQATAAERSRRRARRTSILDAVHGQARDVSGRLGAMDRAHLSDYLDSVRELERRLQGPGLECPEASVPGAPADDREHVDVMNEVIVLALRCDATRAVTFMLGNSASDRDYGFLGVDGTHHALSHHGGRAEAIADLETIGAWEVDRFADLVRRLADTPDGDGTLLDSTLCLMSSELSDGNLHRHDDLPVLLAGGEATGVVRGRHLQYPGRAWGDLLLSILHRLEVPLDAFGEDGRSPIDEL